VVRAACEDSWNPVVCLCEALRRCPLHELGKGLACWPALPLSTRCAPRRRLCGTALVHGRVKREQKVSRMETLWLCLHVVAGTREVGLLLVTGQKFESRTAQCAIDVQRGPRWNFCRRQAATSIPEVRGSVSTDAAALVCAHVEEGVDL